MKTPEQITRHAARKRARYNTDPEFREAHLRANKAWRERNPDYYKAAQQKWRERNPGYNWRKKNPEAVARARQLRRAKTYGLSAEDFEQLWQNQDGKCAICKVCLMQNKLNVDHCHETGKVRGILCWNCNVAIGQLKDDPALLVDAAAYLMENS